MPFGIIKAAARLGVLAHGHRFAGEQTSRPGAMVRLQTQLAICVSRGQLLKTVGKLPALDHAAPAIGRYPKAKDRHEQLTGIARSFAQFVRSLVGSRRRTGDETFGRQE